MGGRIAASVLALALLRADMFPDASNAKLPEAQQNLGIMPSLASFGAVCDGTTDDAAAFAAAGVWMAAGHGRVVSLPAAVCATSQTVVIGNGRQRSTSLTGAAAAGASSLSVTDCTGMVSGDGVVVQLNTATYKSTTSGACSGGVLPITPNLTGAANSGNAVFAGNNSTYNGGGYRGAGGCMTASEISGGEAVSTIKWIGAAAPTTSLTANAAAGAVSLTVASIAGFAGNGLGVPVGVTLDNGRVWWSWAPQTPAGATVQMINELPSLASSGNAVIIAGNPVVRIDGPMLAPVLSGVCLDGNDLAAIGLDARQPMGGKFRGPRGVSVINYTGIGHFIHSARTLIKHATGTVNNDFELYAQAPQNSKTIGAWLTGTPDSTVNDHLKVGFSNIFHGGKLTMGGNDPTAAGLRVEYLDNNTFIKPYTISSAPGLGAGLYRQPSWQRNFFPHENVHIAPAFVGGVVDGTAGGAFTRLKPDYFAGYATSDGEPVPVGAESGYTSDGRYFGLSRLSLDNSTAPTLSACGTSPAIAGNDAAGTITMGTGAPAGCVITFATAYVAAPICNVTWRATPLAVQTYTTSTAALTLTQTATSGNLVDYVCVARSGG